MLGFCGQAGHVTNGIGLVPGEFVNNWKPIGHSICVWQCCKNGTGLLPPVSSLTIRIVIVLRSLDCVNTAMSTKSAKGIRESSEANAVSLAGLCKGLPRDLSTSEVIGVM